MPQIPLDRSIHSTDRNLYRACRRRWGWSSSMREGLRSTGDQPTPLWFGSGFHFAAEDTYGWQRYPSPTDAFRAYVTATLASGECPFAEGSPELREQIALAGWMLGHLDYWHERWGDMETVWVEGKPQVEVGFSIPLHKYGLPAWYCGTFDRIIEDPYGRKYLVDYKTFARLDVSKWSLDPQMAAYLWSFRELYGEMPAGVVLVQILKKTPEPPIVLANGNLSVNKGQPTTVDLYQKALGEAYDGEIPEKQQEFLRFLKSQESPEGDAFCRRELIRRNASQAEAELSKILAEGSEMINPSLPLYPNPVATCPSQCEFYGACLAFDDGSDYEFMLQSQFAPKGERDSWRAFLPDPTQKASEVESAWETFLPIVTNGDESWHEKQESLST